MSRKLTITSLLSCVLLVLCGCQPEAKMTENPQPKLYKSLPDTCNTPDGMTLAPDGNIILACPNFNEPEYPGILMKIDKNDEFTKFCDLPAHPETGYACPMGLDFGPDGNLYYADNQYFYDEDHKSRLIRVNIEDGKPVSTEVVVDGFKLSNAVIWKGSNVYVSDTFFDLENTPGASGIYKISLEDMNNGPVKLKPNAEDERLIARFITTPNDRNDSAGADGLTFDSKGNLYTGMFGNGAFYKITFNEDGSVKENNLLVKDPEMPCVDGIFYDKKSNLIFVTDSQRNAIHTVTPDGKRNLFWVNDDVDGSEGLLDQPCEPIIRGGKLIIANFDMPFPGLKNSEYDEHHTLSYFKLYE